MKTIFLIGFMGSGKTTIGKMLSHKMGLPVLDTDEEIVQEMGMSINQIFETNGEEHFRNLESMKLLDVPLNNVIVTTGGGIVLKQENRVFLKGNGTVVFLDAKPEEIVSRLKNDDTRPLLKDDLTEKVQTLLKLRLPLYVEASHFKVQTTERSLDEICDDILACLATE